MIGGASASLLLLLTVSAETTKFGGVTLAGDVASTVRDLSHVERTTPNPKPTKIPIKMERKDFHLALFESVECLEASLRPSVVDPYFRPTKGLVSELVIVQAS